MTIFDYHISNNISLNTNIQISENLRILYSQVQYQKMWKCENLKIENLKISGFCTREFKIWKCENLKIWKLRILESENLRILYIKFKIIKSVKIWKSENLYISFFMPKSTFQNMTFLLHFVTFRDIFVIAVDTKISSGELNMSEINFYIYL